MAESKKTTKKSTSTKSTTKKTVAKSATKKAPVKEVKTVKEEKITKPVEKKEVKTEVKPVEKKIEVKKEVKSSNFIKDNSKNLLLGLICILLVINIVLIVLGHKVKLSNGNEVIASIKDKEYTAEQLFDKLKEKYGKDALITLIDEYISDKELSDDDKADAKTEAKKYIDSIKSQYESAGYTWDDVLKQYGYANEDALINEYLVSVKQQKVVTNYLGKQLTDDEIKKYYDENIYGTYTVKHILVKPATGSLGFKGSRKSTPFAAQSAAEEAAKAKAQEVITKYAAGEDWKTLVNDYSEDEGSKESEGLVENFTKGDVDDEFFKASIALKDGEYTSEPVKSSFGYHVILKVSETAKKSLDDSKNDIIDALVNEKLNNDSKLYNSTWAKIRNDFKLTINDTQVKSEYEKSINE